MADVPEFAQASALVTYTHNTTVNLKGVVAKYVARVDARGLDPTTLLRLPEDEVGRLLAPAAQQPQYGERVAPHYAEVHRELKPRA